MEMDARQRKSNVLSKINSVLVVAGLNDTVWSIRDCDSTLFVLVFKKLFGKVCAPDRARTHKHRGSPASSAHAAATGDRRLTRLHRGAHPKL
eukprot:7385113-Prymnesium_polylepis.2